MINNLAKESMKEYLSHLGNGDSQVTGKTDSVDRGKLGKPVIPVLLTLLAGLGGGIFALKSDAVPSEPRDDSIKASTSSAEAASLSEAVALVEPNFSAKAAQLEPATSAARISLVAAPSAPGFKLGAIETVFDALPAPIAANLPVAARLVAELPLDEQPQEIAAPAAPAVTVVAAATVQPINDVPGARPEASPASQPTAALASNIGVAAERPAQTEPAATLAAAPAPAAAPEAAPVPQLAIADWNYSLPEQSSSADSNAFAAAAGNAPITLVPNRATPARAEQRAAARSSGARSGNRAQLATPAGRSATAIGNRKIAGHGFASAINGRGKYQFVGSEIEFQLPVVANGAPVGDLTLHVAPNQQVSLRLRELLALFHDQIDPGVLTALVASPNIDSFVTFDKLRDAGIDIRYDAARDRLALSVEQP